MSKNMSTAAAQTAPRHGLQNVRTLVSCAEQAGYRLVAVTLRDGDDWNDHEALYRWGFLLTGIQETLETRLLGALGSGREVSP